MSQPCRRGVEQDEAHRDQRDLRELQAERLGEHEQRDESFPELIQAEDLASRLQPHAPLRRARARIGSQRDSRESRANPQRDSEVKREQRARRNTAQQTSPRLVTAEQALAIRHHTAEIERQRATLAREFGNDDRHRVRGDQQSEGMELVYDHTHTTQGRGDWFISALYICMYSVECQVTGCSLTMVSTS